MNRVFIFLSSVIFIVELFIIGNISASAQNAPDLEEYLVYASLLEQKFIRPETTELVIRKQTMIDDFEDKRRRNKILDLSKLLGEEIISDFESRNKNSAELTDKFNLKVKMNFLDEEIKEIFGSNHPLNSNPERWESFHKKYPTAGWVVALSRVGFNKQKTEAFIFVGDACGFVCGEGNAYLLLKKDNLWKIEKKMMFWVS